MNSKRTLAALAATIAVMLVGGALAADAAPSPSVTTGGVTNVGQFSAVMHGVVRPNGSDTSYQFEYGLTKAYGDKSPVRSAGHGTSAVAVRAGTVRLLPDTVYHYRLTAQSKFGTTLGRDRTFKTTGHPVAVAGTGPATNPSASSITLTGVVNPNHVTTAYYFNYGLTPPAYGSRTPTQTVSGNAGPQIVAQEVQGLQSGTVFHYQLVAVNRGVPVFGSDAMFMTFPNPAPTPQVHKSTRPHRDRHAPFVYTVSGHITHPSWIPSQFACAGNTAISLFWHRHKLTGTQVAVGPDCSFSAQLTLNRKPGHGKRKRKVDVRVLVHYLGDGYLAPARAKVGHVTAG